ncbi:MAG: ABC transporter substrate-binding protein [Reyranellaceae bacterium]
MGNKTTFRLGMAGAAIACSLLLAGIAQAADKLKVVISSTSFAWLPLYVADGAGLFAKEGLDVEIVNVKDGTVVVTAIINGDADVAGVGGNAVFASRHAGQPVKFLTPMNTEYTSTIFARKELLQKAGITEKSTVEQKMQVLKGARIGVISFNGGQHTMMRFLFAKYLGGVDVDKAAEIVPIGDSTNTLAAMRRGAIDASAFSPPVPEKAVADGYAAILLDMIGGEVPETRGMVFTAMAVTEKGLADKGKQLAAFVRAIDAADKLIQADILAAGKAARKHLTAMDSELYELGIKAMKPASPHGAETPIEGLKKYRELLAFGGTAYAKGDFDFEASVSNQFVRDALAGKR